LVAGALCLNIPGSEFVKTCNLGKGSGVYYLDRAAPATPAAVRLEEARGRSGDRAKMERGRQDKS
jgi:hypothetical protein